MFTASKSYALAGSRVGFLVGDPAKNGEIDLAGLNKAWAEAFGTAAQPNKPARSTVQVGLATPGPLVEIELVAVKKP